MNLTASLFLLAGCITLLISSLQLLRVHKTPALMQIITAFTSGGLLFILVGTMFHFRDWEVTLKLLFAVACLFVFTPYGTHIIASTYFERQRKDEN